MSEVTYWFLFFLVQFGIKLSINMSSVSFCWCFSLFACFEFPFFSRLNLRSKINGWQSVSCHNRVEISKLKFVSNSSILLASYFIECQSIEKIDVYFRFMYSNTSLNDGKDSCADMVSFYALAHKKMKYLNLWQSLEINHNFEWFYWNWDLVYCLLLFVVYDFMLKAKRGGSCVTCFTIVWIWAIYIQYNGGTSLPDMVNSSFCCCCYNKNCLKVGECAALVVYGWQQNICALECEM